MKKSWIFMMAFIGIVTVAASLTLVGCGDATGGRITLRGGNQ